MTLPILKPCTGTTLRPFVDGKDDGKVNPNLPRDIGSGGRSIPLPPAFQPFLQPSGFLSWSPGCQVPPLPRGFLPLPSGLLFSPAQGLLLQPPLPLPSTKPVAAPHHSSHHQRSSPLSAAMAAMISPSLLANQALENDVSEVIPPENNKEEAKKKTREIVNKKFTRFEKFDFEPNDFYPISFLNAKEIVEKIKKLDIFSISVEKLIKIKNAINAKIRKIKLKVFIPSLDLKKAGTLVLFPKKKIVKFLDISTHGLPRIEVFCTPAQKQVRVYILLSALDTQSLCNFGKNQLALALIFDAKTKSLRDVAIRTRINKELTEDIEQLLDNVNVEETSISPEDVKTHAQHNAGAPKIHDFRIFISTFYQKRLVTLYTDFGQKE